jgi:hypothetical protein
VNGVWVLIALLAAGGALLLVRALRDVRQEIGHTVDSFTRFRAALAPALVELRDETRDVTLRREPAPGPGNPSPRR